MMSEPSEEVRVVIDVHEPAEVSVHVDDHPDVDDWAIHQLDAADLIVNGVGFERKTASDYASSVLEDRLDRQVQKLGDAFDHAYVLLDDDLSGFENLTHTKLPAKSLRGSCASLTARHGIIVIPCGSTERLVDMAVRLGRKHTESPTSSEMPSVGTDGRASVPIQMWACIPGIGPTRAEALADEFGAPTVPAWRSVKKARVIDDLTAVDGIGETTAEGMYEYLRGDPDA